MTLIIGTPHWNGICFNSDTRVTNTRTSTYEDNARKMAHIHGGVGMVACGDRTSAIMVRETVRKHLDTFAKSGIQFPQSVDLQNVFQTLLLESLKELRDHPNNNERPIYDVSSSGLFGVNINDQPLTLNSEEATKLIKIIVEGAKINDIYSKNIEQISHCANGQIPNALLKDFKQHTLYRYKVKLYDDSDDDIYEVEKVPFGKIIALGSGSEFDYEAVESKVLSYALFSNGAENVRNGAFHLGMIHHYAEQLVPLDKRFNFRTFGGAVIGGTIETDNKNMGSTNVLLGDITDKTTGLVISSVSEKNNELWVKIANGDELKLEDFPDQITEEEQLSWL
jgi:hypothetical protein